MTATLPPLPAPVGALAAFDAVVAIELPCVSTAEYNSHEICKIFAENLRSRLSAIAAQAQPAPIVVQSEPMQSFADRIKNGIADHLSDNAPMRRYDLAEIDELIRSVEIRADMLAATPPTVQPVQPTPLTDAQIEVLWGDFMSAAGSGHVPDFVRAIEAVHGIGAPAIDQTTGGVL